MSELGDSLMHNQFHDLKNLVAVPWPFTNGNESTDRKGYSTFSVGLDMPSLHRGDVQCFGERRCLVRQRPNFPGRFDDRCTSSHQGAARGDQRRQLREASCRTPNLSERGCTLSSAFSLILTPILSPKRRGIEVGATSRGAATPAPRRQRHSGSFGPARATKALPKIRS